MEITGELTVTIDQETLLDMHSVLNVFNVIVAELNFIAHAMDDPANLMRLQETAVQTARSLHDPEKAFSQVHNIETLISTVEHTISSAMDAHPEAAGNPVVVQGRENLESIFSILRVRAREIEARAASPDAWVRHEIDQLKTNFVNVFSAIELNSHGAYRIIYNVAAHEERDYLVNFDITSVDGATITMPAVFQDVMRDLIANARKYTPPGGRIDAGLHASVDELRFVVTDSGAGIPPDEIERVVFFGERGSNVRDLETRGGGFGLTKAYYVTRRFGGRMWIDSPVVESRGTRIEIRLPRP